MNDRHEVTSTGSGRVYHQTEHIGDPTNPYQPLAEAIHHAITPILDSGTTTVTCGRIHHSGVATLVVTNEQDGKMGWQLMLSMDAAPWFMGDLTPASLRAIGMATETRLEDSEARTRP